MTKRVQKVIELQASPADSMDMTRVRTWLVPKSIFDRSLNETLSAGSKVDSYLYLQFLKFQNAEIKFV